MDHRGDREDSDALVATTKNAVEASLAEGGVRVDDGAPARLEIRIRQYRADFELGE